MSHISSMPTYLNEYYEVEKTIEVVTNESPAKRIRIDALKAHDHYCTAAYIQEYVVMQPMSPQENSEYSQKPREMRVWVEYDLPWTNLPTADQAINQALGFLSERVRK